MRGTAPVNLDTYTQTHLRCVHAQHESLSPLPSSLPSSPPLLSLSLSGKRERGKGARGKMAERRERSSPRYLRQYTPSQNPANIGQRVTNFVALRNFVRQCRRYLGHLLRLFHFLLLHGLLLLKQLSNVFIARLKATPRVSLS